MDRLNRYLSCTHIRYTGFALAWIHKLSFKQNQRQDNLF